MTHATLCLVAAMLNFAGFAWGMAAHFRRVGDPTPAMKVTALLAVACTASQLYALAARPPWHASAALVLYTVSAALYWSAISTTRGKLAACGQGAISREIIKSGPYRLIRHPFYTAYNLTWVAGLIATGWMPLSVSVVTMTILYELSAREEETGFLNGSLASEYRDYQLRSGRYIPMVWRR